MVETAGQSANLYELVSYLVDVVGLSVTKACKRSGMSRFDFYRERRKAIEKEKAGASEQTTGTTHAETPGANPIKDTHGVSAQPTEH